MLDARRRAASQYIGEVDPKGAVIGWITCFLVQPSYPTRIAHADPQAVLEFIPDARDIAQFLPPVESKAIGRPRIDE